jgi:hypothetical protein
MPGIETVCRAKGVLPDVLPPRGPQMNSAVEWSVEPARAGEIKFGLATDRDSRRRRLKGKDRPLLGPEHQKLNKPRSVEAARHSALDRRPDEVWLRLACDRRILWRRAL